MGRNPARAVTDALDRFFAHYFQRRPVNATFTGEHAYDGLLPDWSLEGLLTLDAEMRTLHDELSALHPPGASARALRDFPAMLDAELARAFLEIQRAELASAHGVRGNPALWTGEAVFGIVSLMIRDFAPFVVRARCAVERCEAIPAFLMSARRTIGAHAIPAAWSARALREGEGAGILLGDGIARWLDSQPNTLFIAPSLRDAALRAADAFASFADWLREQPVAPDAEVASGTELYDLLLARGHFCTQSRDELLRAAYGELAAARRSVDETVADEGGSWTAVQERLAADHASADDFLQSFTRRWNECRDLARDRDVVEWPDWPLRYVTIPEWTRGAAPFLYYLYYRSPAPYDASDVHDYVVPSLPEDAEQRERFLRTWNRSVITLNHVVHHGAVGHHVQNWHATHRAATRVGRVAAVDCASRIGMFAGGTMAEGWACYATALMDELGLLTPLERVSEQHSQLRFLARAIVDIELHQQSMTVKDAVQFFEEQTGMDPSVAAAEVAKCSMFPCTAVMYWLGTREIRQLRERRERDDPAGFTLRHFHDELLGFGSIPVPLIARLMTEGVA